METYIAYFDETGDDGLKDSPTDLFVLTSVYVASSKWEKTFKQIKAFRRELKDVFNLNANSSNRYGFVVYPK